MKKIMRALITYPLIGIWGLLTALMFAIYPEAAFQLLKSTAEEVGVTDV